MLDRVLGHVTLVACADVMTRNLLTTLLQGEGYIVLSAADGREALELSRVYRGTIDMLLTDAGMTGLHDLCSQLAGERPDVKVLVMMGKETGGISGRDVTLGATPATSDGVTLIGKVRAVLAAPPQSAPFVYLVFLERLPLDLSRGIFRRSLTTQGSSSKLNASAAAMVPIES
jgi:CheY-like chemotaxis protein